MDQERFDWLIRHVSEARTRRVALGRLVGGGLAAAMLAVAPGTGEASQTVKGCRIPGQGCSRNAQCCSDKCNNKQCKCLDRGRSCLVVVSPKLPPLPNKAVCCSSKCSRGRNRCL